MKFLLAIILGVLLLGLVPLARAAITNSSRVIPYQGRLTDSSGNNVADSTYAMTFKIYTVSSGGSASFTEDHSSVTVSSGLFSVLLGSLSASGVNLDFANPPYYLGITVASNSEMTPRIQLGFAPLAHNSQYLDGTPLSSFQLNTGVLTGAAGTNTRLQATGTGTGSTGNGSIYFLNSSGATTGRFETITFSGATGGTIATASGYTVHTFTTSGTFAPNGNGNVEYLVVGGGGGGGRENISSGAGGGGGAGGFRTDTGFAVTAQSYTVTIGAGGAGYTGAAGQGSDGGNSVFGTITSIGGGGGGGGTANPVNGRAGGSGGGSASGLGGSTFGSGTSGQGNNGGSAGGGTNGAPAGGGGGAGAVGGNSTSTNGGAGGSGVESSISGSSVTYAGGGGGCSNSNNGSGGVGGAGGGGTGATYSSANATAGTANTGGGGGGSGNGSYTAAAAGGSGIVIIRYLTNGYGTMYLGATNTSSADLAEYYVSGDKNMEPGDVVSIASDNNSKGVLLKSNKSYDSKLVGVISTNPGVVLGSIDGDTGKSDKRQLALAGRVPVKIDPDSEPINVGDFLTSSDKPGYAKKATESGYVIGKALEKWSPSIGSGQIEVFINLIYANAEKRFNNQQLQIDQLRQIVCLDHPENKICL